MQQNLNKTKTLSVPTLRDETLRGLHNSAKIREICGKTLQI